MDNYLKPSYDEIHSGCKTIITQIKKEGANIGAVVGVVRGGLLPAVIISHMLNVPMITFDYSSKSGKGNNKDHSNQLPELDSSKGPYLIVDDIADSGQTLNDIVHHYSLKGVTVYTAVLYAKEGNAFSPEFFWRELPHNSGWVDFPFEMK